MVSWRISWDFPGGRVVKNPPCNAGDVGLIQMGESDENNYTA